jgi:hypothetical protein
VRGLLDTKVHCDGPDQSTKVFVVTEGVHQQGLAEVAEVPQSDAPTGEVDMMLKKASGGFLPSKR